MIKSHDSQEKKMNSRYSLRSSTHYLSEALTIFFFFDVGALEYSKFFPDDDSVMWSIIKNDNALINKSQLHAGYSITFSLFCASSRCIISLELIAKNNRTGNSKV